MKKLKIALFVIVFIIPIVFFGAYALIPGGVASLKAMYATFSHTLFYTVIKWATPIVVGLFTAVLIFKLFNRVDKKRIAKMQETELAEKHKLVYIFKSYILRVLVTLDVALFCLMFLCILFSSWSWVFYAIIVLLVIGFPAYIVFIKPKKAKDASSLDKDE